MKNKTLRTIITCLLATVLLQACGSSRKAAMILDEAEANFEAGNYATAFDQLQPLAMRGDPDAQYAVAYMYYYGYGTPKDINTARSWMREAAEQGNPAAVDGLIMMAEQNARLYATPEEDFIRVTPDDVLEDDSLQDDRLEPFDLDTFDDGTPLSEVDINTIDHTPLSEVDLSTLDHTPLSEVDISTLDVATLDDDISESGPTADVSISPSGEEYGPIAHQETLWSIASQIERGEDISTKQVADAIFSLNPDAFFENDIGQLMEGSTLRLPTAEEIKALG